MKASVIFAVSIFDYSRVFVLREFLDTFKMHYAECDFYIGINYGSIPEVESVIDEYELNVQVARVVNESLYCGSDASAYQAALKLLKDSNISYDLCWFAHTKGAVNQRSVERDMYLKNLYSKRNEIENLFQLNEYLGSYALRGVTRSAANDIWSEFNRDHIVDVCSNKIFGQLQYPHVNWSYIETMYVIKGNLVDTFLELATDDYFNTKIEEPCYFEVIFPWIVSRCGYFPYIKDAICFFGEGNINQSTKDWIIKNNLNHLEPYLNL